MFVFCTNFSLSFVGDKINKLSNKNPQLEHMNYSPERLLLFSSHDRTTMAPFEKNCPISIWDKFRTHKLIGNLKNKWLKKECTLYKRVMIRSALNFWKWEWKSERTHFFSNEWELSEAQKINERWTRWNPQLIIQRLHTLSSSLKLLSEI